MEHDAEPAQAKRAVAYYRPSARKGNDVPIPVQRERVREFARQNGIEIIKEFVDRTRSHRRRKAFNEMFRDYVTGGKKEFRYVLVLDVDRWGRFQNADLSAYFAGLCLNNGKQVVYTSRGLPVGEPGLVCRNPFAHLRSYFDEQYGGKMKRIVRIASRLLKSEKIEGRRKLLRQILDIVRSKTER